MGNEGLKATGDYGFWTFATGDYGFSPTFQMEVKELLASVPGENQEASY